MMKRPQSGKHILLADDDQALTEVTQEMLVFFGHRVTVAQNGHEALAHYLSHQAEFDLVITDLDMPVMDGHALVLALCAEHPDVKIIIITGNSKEVEKSDSLIYKVDYWLAKPFLMNDLMAAIERVV
jgi:CheY-like chemotaxis protein